MAADRVGEGRALGVCLWQLGVGCSRLLVNESHGVSNRIVDVSQVHALARFIEPESTTDWYPGACWRYLFVGTPDVLEMVGNDVHQCELQRFVTPLLTELCTADAAFVGRTIDGVKDRHASKVSKPNRATIAVKLVERRIDYDLEVSSKGFHVRYPRDYLSYVTQSHSVMHLARRRQPGIPEAIPPSAGGAERRRRPRNQSIRSRFRRRMSASRSRLVSPPSVTCATLARISARGARSRSGSMTSRLRPTCTFTGTPI